MSEGTHERIVLLNRTLSRSVTSAPETHKPETHGLEELFGIINGRRSKGHAIEYLGGLDDEDEAQRKANRWGLICCASAIIASMRSAPSDTPSC